MHFSWKDIVLYRLLLVLLIPLAILLLAVTYKPAEMLAPLVMAMYLMLGHVGTLLCCVIVLGGLWIGYFVLLTFLREKLRQQQEARKAIEPLYWYACKAMMLSPGEIVEFTRDSGSLLTIRPEADSFRITDIGTFTGAVELLLSRRSVINMNAPSEVVSLDYVTRLRGEINVHANQLRIALS